LLLLLNVTHRVRNILNLIHRVRLHYVQYWGIPREEKYFLRVGIFGGWNFYQYGWEFGKIFFVGAKFYDCEKRTPDTKKEICKVSFLVYLLLYSINLLIKMVSKKKKKSWRDARAPLEEGRCEWAILFW
jgi:hypothetical protein